MQQFSQPLYAVTISLPLGVDELVKDIIQFLESKYEQGVGVTEPHLSGKLHLHCLVYRDVKQPCKVTQMFIRFLKSKNVEHGKNAVLTKRANDPKGWVAYMNKTATTYCWLKGYKETWLQSHKYDLKKISLNVLNKDEYYITRTTFIRIFEKYAVAESLTYDCKLDVMNICKTMSKEGYQFSGVWNNLKGLTAEVLNRIGSNDASEEWENAFGIRNYMG